MNAELSKKIDQACTTAEEFTKHFYNQMDKRRHQIGKMYLDTAELVWNGNGVAGSERIQRFLLELPTSEHVLNVLDAQPVHAATATSVLVQAGGTVTYSGRKNPQFFQQTFFITAHEDKWKVVSDCFRMVNTEIGPR